MALLLAVLTFLIVVCVVMAVWLAVLSGARQDIVGQRLEAVRKVERRGEISTDVKILRDEMLSTVPAVNRIMMQWSWTANLKKFLNQAGLTCNTGQGSAVERGLGVGDILHSRILQRPNSVVHPCRSLHDGGAIRCDCLVAQ